MGERESCGRLEWLGECGELYIKGDRLGEVEGACGWLGECGRCGRLEWLGECGELYIKGDRLGEGEGACGWLGECGELYIKGDRLGEVEMCGETDLLDDNTDSTDMDSSII